MTDHYQVLGVSRGATPQEIRRAYYRAARSHHPDLNEGDGSTMAEINLAWAVLGDPAHRRAYDEGFVASARQAHTPDDDDDERPAWAMEPDVDSRQAGLGAQAVVLVPAAVLLCAVGLFALSTVLASGGLMAAAIVLVPVAGASFVAAPLLILRRRHR